MVSNTYNISTGTAVRIPAVGFGTFMIPPDAATDVVIGTFKCKYCHVYTAQVYNNEAAVGEALKRAFAKESLSRSNLFIMTKLWPGAAGLGEDANYEAETVAELHASLHRLGLD